MFEVRAETAIAAPSSVVWEVLVDVENYSEWSTMLHYLGGNMVVGEKVQLRLDAPSGPSYEFSPRILALSPEAEFTWKATTGFSGVFDGEHSFKLEKVDDMQTKLLNREVYSGVLSPIMRRLPMIRDAAAGFEAMNAEIKQRAESLYQAVN